MPSRPLPASLLALSEVMRAGETLAIEATAENDRAKLRQALAIQPTCPDLDAAKRAATVLSGVLACHWHKATNREGTGTP